MILETITARFLPKKKNSKEIIFEYPVADPDALRTARNKQAALHLRRRLA